MSTIFLVLLILLNVGIAWWNCYAVGSVWKDTMAFGSRFEKALLYSGAVQSTAGFSVPILLFVTWVVTLLLQTGDTPAPPEQINAIWAFVMNLWYVAIIIPVVGSGFIIWGHSMREAWKNRDLGSVAVAGWNTFAQVSNTVSMFNNLGPAINSVFKESKNSNVWLLGLMIVVVALLSSVLLTAKLIQYYAAKAPSRIAEMAYR